MDRNSPAMQPALAPEDFYFDGPYMVFTAAYHMKRGYCCGSGCRHCPYRGAAADAPAAPDGPSAGDCDPPE
ncbi:MAG: hypothetical protein KGM96_11250 [Acidobacteriota bacterium]|nr:hypothetical protein [Acidobacteriota bacterium]